MKLLIYILAIFVAIPVSCSKGKSTNVSGADMSANDTVTGAVAADTVESKPEPLKFENPEDLKAWMRESDHNVEYAEGIIPLIADYSLDYATNLLNNEHSRFIVVDKSRMKVLLFDKYGREEKSYGMCCAKNYGTKHKRADARTPEGYFSVKGVFDSSDWLFTDDEGHTSDKKGQFGPRFIRLDVPQIGIHGTCAPWSIGGRSSHGCIRIKNENILELVEFVEKGMPVIIVPGKRDIAVNEQEGYDIPWIPTYIGARHPNVAAPKQVAEVKKDEVPHVEPEESVAVDSSVDSAANDDSIPVVSPDTLVNDTTINN